MSPKDVSPPLAPNIFWQFYTLATMGGTCTLCPTSLPQIPPSPTPSSKVEKVRRQARGTRKAAFMRSANVNNAPSQCRQPLWEVPRRSRSIAPVSQPCRAGGPGCLAPLVGRAQRAAGYGWTASGKARPFSSHTQTHTLFLSCQTHTQTETQCMESWLRTNSVERGVSAEAIAGIYGDGKSSGEAVWRYYTVLKLPEADYAILLSCHKVLSL